MTTRDDVDILYKKVLMKEQITQFVESKAFQWGIVVVIVVNAITLGLEITPSVGFLMPLLSVIDQVAFLVFVGELALKLYVYRAGYFRQGWNVFDFTIVVLTALPYLSIVGLGNLTVLRALRILRALRLITVVPAFRQVIGTLGHSLSGVGAVGSVLFIAMYVSSVLATKLFGNIAPDNFGTLGTSLLSMFTIMTMEGWRGIVDPIAVQMPFVYPFFILYILGCAFVLFNLFITVLVSASEKQHQEEHLRDEAEVKLIEAKIDELQNTLNAYLSKKD
jgi:voltage-gated sodium channel